LLEPSDELASTRTSSRSEAALDPAVQSVLGEALTPPSVTEIRHVTENRHVEFSKISVLRAGFSSFRDFEPAIIGSKVLDDSVADLSSKILMYPAMLVFATLALLFRSE